MYKILVIDDEKQVRDRLINLIKKNFSSDFEVVGNYDNGYDALLNGVTLNPDIMITDIKMPYIDGIELVKRMKMELPLIEAIIISGYDLFNYAKEAIELDVINYLTKPVDTQELKDSLYKAKDKLDNRKRVERINEIEEKVNDSFDAVINEDLNSLLQYNEVPDFLDNKIKNYGINLDFSHLLIGAIDFDKENKDIKVNEVDTIYKSLKEVIKYEFNQKNLNYVFFKGNTKYVLFLLSDEKFDREFIHLKSASVLANILKLNNTSLSISFAEASKVDGSFNYRRTFKRCLRVYDYKSLVGDNVILFYDDFIQSNISFSKKIEEKDIKDICYEVFYGSKENCKNKTHTFINNISSGDYKNVYFYGISLLINELLHNCIDINELFSKYMDYNLIIQEVLNFKNKEYLIEFLDKFIDKIYEINEKSREEGVSKSFINIRDYINKNYRKSSLSLESLGEDLGFSVSYISAILRKNNTNFTKMVTDLRMKDSEELLLNTDDKIINIANVVGYEDPYYFSHVFKKYYGVSPVEYKKKKK